jgi:hypothetical protein
MIGADLDLIPAIASTPPMPMLAIRYAIRQA